VRSGGVFTRKQFEKKNGNFSNIFRLRVGHYLFRGWDKGEICVVKMDLLFLNSYVHNAGEEIGVYICMISWYYTVTMMRCGYRRSLDW
jgi:hypothetical protein